MMGGVLGFDLDHIGYVDVGESDGVGFGVRDLLVDLFGLEEGEFFELLDWSRLLHLHGQYYKSISNLF